MIRSSALFAGCLLLAVSVHSPARAQAPCGYGHPWMHSIYSVESIPYFALHPPVYYSLPVPRPYGYSPFAYPGTVMTPEPKPVEPQRVINPHVKPKADDEKKADPAGLKTASVPERIVNPFYAAERRPEVAPARLARP